MPKGKRFDWEAARAQIEQLYPQLGAAKTAALFGLNERCMWKKATFWGLKSPHQQKKELFYGSMNHDYFETWSIGMAYDLGNGWADGSVGSRSYYLRVATQDEQIIIGTRDRIGSLHKINRFTTVSPKTGKLLYGTRIAIGSRRLVASLKNTHGMLPRKSELDLPLPRIPGLWQNHFCRGYLDGDGSVRRNKKQSFVTLSFHGTPLFIEGLRQILVDHTGVRLRKIQQESNTDKTFKVEWHTEWELRALYHFLYPPGDYPYLPRKRTKLEQALGITP
jgi:hypothetical protein